MAHAFITCFNFKNMNKETIWKDWNSTYNNKTLHHIMVIVIFPSPLFYNTHGNKTA